MPNLKKIPTDSILFTMPFCEKMAMDKQMGNFTLGQFTLNRFPNDELHITLHTPVKNSNCIVLGTIAPPEFQLFAFLLLCHTLKKEKASTIIAVLPYLAYSRHDKNEPQKSQAVALIGQLFASAGVTHIVTIDIHNTQVKRFFPMPLISLSPAKLFASEIVKLSFQEVTFVAPDEGAINRCKAVANQVSIQHEIAYMKKVRTDQSIVHSTLHGKISKHVIIVDDILDTGGTLVSCCERLCELGVKEIDIMITHGCFTGNKWQKLWELGINRIYCTDTVPLSDDIACEKIVVISMAPLLVHELKKLKEVNN